VEGRLETRKWQDKSGQDRYTTEIVATDMQMLDSRGQGQGGGPQSSGGGQWNEGGAPQRQQAPAQAADAPPFGDIDDDIPF